LAAPDIYVLLTIHIVVYISIYLNSLKYTFLPK